MKDIDPVVAIFNIVLAEGSSRSCCHLMIRPVAVRVLYWVLFVACLFVVLLNLCCLCTAVAAVLFVACLFVVLLNLCCLCTAVAAVFCLWYLSWVVVCFVVCFITSLFRRKEKEKRCGSQTDAGFALLCLGLLR